MSTQIKRKPNIEIKFEEDLYFASQGDLFHQIQSIEDDISSVMLVGHNPGMHGIAHMLAKLDATPKRIELSNSYRTCTLTILGSHTEKWRDIAPQSFDLIDYIRLNYTPN